MLMRIMFLFHCNAIQSGQGSVNRAQHVCTAPLQGFQFSVPLFYNLFAFIPILDDI